jgi:hypothetical protein
MTADIARPRLMLGVADVAGAPLTGDPFISKFLGIPIHMTAMGNRGAHQPDRLTMLAFVSVPRSVVLVRDARQLASSLQQAPAYTCRPTLVCPSDLARLDHLSPENDASPHGDERPCRVLKLHRHHSGRPQQEPE